MSINPFHVQSAEPPPRPMPRPKGSRFYALLIEGGGGDDFMLFDAVGADWFDSSWVGGSLEDQAWRRLLDSAPVAAIEVNARDGDTPRARQWLADNPLEPGQWVEVAVTDDAGGPARIYMNLFVVGDPVRFDLIRRLAPPARAALQASTALKPSKPAELQALIPSGAIDHVIVCDVGQGGAQALVDGVGEIGCYVDLGGGVLADTHTWPSKMSGFCLSRNPLVVLTHWHYDHFSSANRFPAARTCPWIAPDQPLGPGPQATFAAALVTAGTLRVWPRSLASLRSGPLLIELCKGKTQNSSGLAVTVDGPPGDDPILLPADAHYTAIPSAPGASYASFVASHHGGRAGRWPPTDPGFAHSRVVVSCGPGNSYGHPLGASLNDIAAVRWTLGSTGRRADDRRTEDRPIDPGHVGLSWGGTPVALAACTCVACSMTPVQW